MLAGCASAEEDAAYVERPAEDIYLEAQASLESNSTEQAAKLFDEVERQHPYSNWATRAQLMAAYAHYRGLRYPDAIDTLDRFIQLHPGHKDVAYAYYLRALCYYEQITDVARDQAATANALEALQTVANRFPDTAYARDALLKLDLARDHLAGREMEIGRYYQRQQLYLAGITRFKTVITDYQTTSHVAEALHRLTESYLALGLRDEAKIAAATLGYNFPGSRWYSDSYALLGDPNLVPAQAEDGWLGRTWKKLL